MGEPPQPAPPTAPDPSGLEAPCFDFIAEALLEQLRHEAICEAIVEPFFNGIPDLACSQGIRDAHKVVQRRLVLMAEAQRLFALMAPHETAIRSLAGIAPGARKVGKRDFVAS